MTTPGPEPAAELPHDTLRAAERLLRRRFGRAAKVAGIQALVERRAGVVRLRLEGSSAPESAILKAVKGDQDQPYDPKDMKPMGAGYRFCAEVAGLEFLESLTPGGGRPLAPRLHGFDQQRGLVVIEDLGDGESLADLLLGSDAARAEAGLLAFAGALGAMHARTAGRTLEYEARMEELGAGRKPNAWHDAVREQIRRIPETFDELDLEWTPGMVDDMQAVAAAMLDPGPALAYTHGDPCPDNNRLVDGRMLLFDFETGGLRNAFLDGAYGRVPFPTCWCCNRIPQYTIEAMESAWRLEAMRGVRAAADDTSFRSGLAAASAYWLIVGANMMLPRALRLEQKWGISTYRQRLLQRFEDFVQTAEEFGELESLAAWAYMTRERLRKKWPEIQEMPLYPAFRGQPV